MSSGQNQGYTPPGNTNAFLTRITDALGHTTSFTYDYNNSQLTSSKDPNGQSSGKVTSYVYNDVFARPTLVSYPDGGQTTLSYNDSPYNPSANTPNVTTTRAITPSLNEISTMATDGVGHVVRTILSSDPDGVDTTDTAYDGLGRVLTRSNPHRTGSLSTDGTATYTYDALGRTKLVTEQDGSSVTTVYDQTSSSNPNVTCSTTTDETLKSRKSCVDGLGRLTQVFEDPSGLNYETDHSYDALDNLLTVNQKGGDPNSANWRTRTFTYDSLSRLTQATNPESGTINYAYDANGNVSSKTDARGITTNYNYDALNRLRQKCYTDGTTPVLYGYDGQAVNSTCPTPPQPPATLPPSITDSNPIGYRTAMRDISGATSWSHDAMGRILKDKHNIRAQSADHILPVLYTYNLDGSLATLTYPSSGRVITYTMNSAGRPLAAQDIANNVNYVQGATYAPFGGLIGMTQGAAPITTANAYNNRFQPATLSAGTPSNTILSLSYDFHLGSGDNGNVFQVRNNLDSTRSAVYQYDALNRIQQANTLNTSSSNCWGEAFTIDPWGNLTNKSVAPGMSGSCNTESFSQSASPQNRLSGFGYDAAGNMTQNGSATYTYDAENRLTSAGGYTYYYDGDGKRVRKTNGSTGTLYWTGTGSDSISETNLSGTVQSEYVFFNGKRVARYDPPSNTYHYYFADHLGSTSVETGGAGTVQNDLDYYPYGGAILHTVNDTGNHYMFTGKERDGESGLDNFGARYNASSMGRFMTPDPLMASARVSNPQTWNRYSYALNNPVKYIDPTGLVEMTADQCQKDPKCVTVKLNVIYDKNANDGKGLTDKQKAKFEENLLQNAQNEFGDAKVHFDVTHTEASESHGNLQGLEKGALNVIVSDSSFTTEAGDSRVTGGLAVTAININAASGDTLSHEMAHQFLGDTRGLTNAGLHWLGSHGGDLGGLAAGILGSGADAVADTLNDVARWHLRNFGYSGGEYNPNCTGCYQWVTPFNQGAKDFQDAITPTQK